MTERERQQLKVMQTEYRAGLEFRRSRVDPRVRQIREEYRLNNMDHIVEYMAEHFADSTMDEVAFSDGRIPLIHVMMRKFEAMVTRDYDFRVQAMPHSPHDEPIADLLDGSFSGVVNEIKLKRVMRMITAYAGMEGTAGSMVNYGGLLVPGQEAWAERIPKDARNENDGEQMLPTGVNVESSFALSMPGMPVLQPIRLKDIVFDPGTKELFPEGPARVYHRMNRRVIDVLRDSRLNRQARAEFSGKFPSDYDWSEVERGLGWYGESHIRRGDVIQCYDFFSNQFCQFSPEGERFLLPWTPVPFDLGGKHPYHFLQPIPDPDSPYGIPYLLAALPSARAANFVSQVGLYQAARDGKRIFVTDSSSGPSKEDIERVNMSRSGEFVDIDLKGKNPQEAIFPMEFGGANPNLDRLEGKFVANANFASQQTDAARNTFDTSRDVTATESLVRQQAQELGIQPIHDRVLDLHQDVAQALLRVMVQNWGAERVVKYMGNDPRMSFWVKVERDRVLKDWHLEVKVGQAQAYDPVTRRQQFNEMLQTTLVLGNAVNQSMMMQAQGVPSPIDYLELLRQAWDDFDPALARRVFGRQDPAHLLERLVLDHRMRVVGATPELLDMIRQNAAGRMQGNPLTDSAGEAESRDMMPPNVAQFPGIQQGGFAEQTGIPQPGEPGPDASAGFSPGMQRGRMMSEMMGTPR